EFVDQASFSKLGEYIDELYRMRARKGITRSEALEMLQTANIFGSMMVHMRDADALISGVTQHYPDTIRPALQVLQLEEGISRVSGMYMMIINNRVYFFADTTVNIEPSSAELAEIALCAAKTARRFGIAPRVAMLSFSNFGSARHPFVTRVRKAAEI